MLARTDSSDLNALPEFGEFYYQAVLAEFKAIPKPSATSDAATKRAWTLAEQTRAKPPTSITWADLFAFENAVAQLQPVERVRRRVYALREKLRGLIGQSAYEGYLKCANLDVAKATGKALRPEIDSLLGEFHWYYSATNTRDSLFYHMRASLARPVLAYSGLVLLWALATGGNLPGLPIFILAGLLGALASILRRLQTAQVQPVSPIEDTVARLNELGMGTVSVWVALASGAIFPVLLFLIFAGQLLTGNLFPVIYTYTPAPGSGGTTFLDFVLRTAPLAGGDFAKMLVWSFVSGFGERFVPDVLDKLVAKGGELAPPSAGKKVDPSEPGQVSAIGRANGTEREAAASNGAGRDSSAHDPRRRKTPHARRVTWQ